MKLSSELRRDLSILLTDFEPTEEIRDLLSSVVRPNPNTIVIPLAQPPSQEENYRLEESKKMLEFYPMLKDDSGEVRYIGSAEANDHHRNLIKNADVIIFTSGDVFELNGSMLHSGLEDVFLGRANNDDRPLMIIAASAGSLYLTSAFLLPAMSRVTVKKKTKLNNPPRIYENLHFQSQPMLGLIEDAYLFVHANDEARLTDACLERFVKISRDKAFALYNHSALYCTGDEIIRVSGGVKAAEQGQIWWMD